MKNYMICISYVLEKDGKTILYVNLRSYKYGKMCAVTNKYVPSQPHSIEWINIENVKRWMKWMKRKSLACTSIRCDWYKCASIITTLCLRQRVFRSHFLFLDWSIIHLKWIIGIVTISTHINWVCDVTVIKYNFYMHTNQAHTYARSLKREEERGSRENPQQQ